LATSGPLPQPARTAKLAAKNSEAESLEISWFRKFRAKKNKFCTQALRLYAADRNGATHVTVQ
jgi:hypothetical protein